MSHSFSLALEHHAPYSPAVRFLADALHYLGWHVHGCTYQALGRQTTFVSLLTIADHPVFAPAATISFSAIQTPDAWQQWKSYLATDAYIFHDGRVPAAAGQTLIPISFEALARQATNQPRLGTYVAAGALLAAMGYADSQIAGLKDISDHQRQAVLIGNQSLPINPSPLKPTHPALQGLIIDGAQALAIALVASGSKLITWQNEVAKRAQQLVEEQSTQMLYTSIAPSAASAVNITIGSSLAGVRSAAVINQQLTTIAPLLQFASTSETPAVTVAIADQSVSVNQIQSIIGAADAPIVMMPANPLDLWQQVVQAGDLADHLQTMVVVIVHQSILWQRALWSDLSRTKITPDRGKLVRTTKAVTSAAYQRYADTSDGISPRKVPGQPGAPFTAGADFSQLAVDKRGRKISRYHQTDLPIVIHGDIAADLTLLSLGHHVGSAIAAAERLGQGGLSTNVVQLPRLSPWPATELIQWLRRCKYVLVIEPSAGQGLTQLVRQHTGLSLRHHVCPDSTMPANQIVQVATGIFKTGGA